MKRPRVPALVAVVACTAVLCSHRQVVVSAQGEGGTIAARVHVVSRPARRLPSAGAYPGRVVSAQAISEASELENVVVFVDAPPTGAPRRHASIRQVNEEFLPHVVAVTAGSTVDFPNDDLIFHNVFSLSRAATFDLGRYPRGTSKTRTFTKPGIVKVFCHLHSHMNAIVRVFGHPYFGMPDRQGYVTIPRVPAGRHKVTAWHERAGELSQMVTIDERGTAELTFSLPLSETE